MIRIEDLIGKWLAFLGIDGERVGRDGKLNHTVHHETRRAHEAVLEAARLDPSNLLAAMMVEDAFLSDMRTARTSVADYLADSTAFSRQVMGARDFLSALEQQGVTNARASIKANLQRAVAHYGASERDDVARVLARPDAVSRFWASGLSMLDNGLETHQFVSGERETTGKLQYQQHVLGFWSPQDAVRLAMDMPSGIALGLVQDRKAVHSHFVFVVRDGANVLLLSDREKWESPIHKEVAAQRGREMHHLEDRMGRAHFPYTDVLRAARAMREGNAESYATDEVAKLQREPFKLVRLSDIDADSVVWIAMMFSLIERRFFKQAWRPQHLSYTAGMVEEPSLLSAAVEAAGLPAVVGATLQAKTYRSADLTRKSFEALSGLPETISSNDWIEDRFKDLVSDEILNPPTAAVQTQTFLLADGRSTRMVEGGEPMPVAPRGEAPLRKLRSLDADDFGTAEDIEGKRLWNARYNQVQALGILAGKEFAERRAEVEKWWTQRIGKRTEFLFEAIRSGGLVATTDMPHANEVPTGFSFSEGSRDDILHRFDVADGGLDHHRQYVRGALELGDFEKGASEINRRCAKSGRPARAICHFLPRTADDIALLAGVRRQDLPDVLQNWVKHPPRHGNEILDAMDPIAFALKDPWRELTFAVTVYVSPLVFPKPAPTTNEVETEAPAPSR